MQVEYYTRHASHTNQLQSLTESMDKVRYPAASKARSKMKWSSLLDLLVYSALAFGIVLLVVIGPVQKLASGETRYTESQWLWDSRATSLLYSMLPQP